MNDYSLRRVRESVLFIEEEIGKINTLHPVCLFWKLKDHWNGNNKLTITLRLTVLWKVKANEKRFKVLRLKKTTTRHSPWSREFILCGDNEISFTIPHSYKLTDLWRPGQGLPRRPQTYERDCSFENGQTMMMLLLKCFWETGFPMSPQATAEFGRHVMGRSLHCALDDTSCITQSIQESDFLPFGDIGAV